MNKKALIYLLVIAVAIGAGLYVWRNNPMSATPVAPTAGNVPILGENLDGEADPARMKLDMKEWIWIANEKFALTFGADGRFSAKTDCNKMGGSYAVQPAGDGTGSITFSQILSTKMYCDDSVEGDFATILENAKSYRFTGRGQLILGPKSGMTTATFR